MNYLTQVSPILLAFLATMFTYSVTALGAALVFFMKQINQKLLDLMMGISAGVMIAASYWSLLEPAISLAPQINQNAALVVAFGFALGGFFIIASDIFIEKQLSTQHPMKYSKSCILLIIAVTMHNIPEGLAIGVAFGSIGITGENSALIGAIMLALGIGIQNFPEGTCVAMPLRREGFRPGKCFFIGQLSGIVEPFAGVLGAMFALFFQSTLPLVLSFSAGAMISVVCQELIPEAFKDNKHLASMGVIIGFVVMMILDVSLGS